MIRKRLIATATILLIATSSKCQDLSSLETYKPKQQLNGTIRSWGHGYLKNMMKLWEADFHNFQPGIQFEDTLVSSASAMAGIYSGRADLAVLAREIIPPEVAAYEKVTKQDIYPVQVLTGSFGNQDKIMAMGIFVNKANPISKLTFSQLDAIFGSERKRGEKANIRTWDQAGLSGGWQKKPIHPYSGLAFEAPGYFFSQTVLNGSVLWNCDLKQFENVEDSEKRYVDAYQKAVDTVATDRYGIALAGAGYRNPNVKLVALAVEDGGPFIEATKENVTNRSYPLARPVRFYINKGRATSADPNVIEFLRYVLSREGQQQVLSEGDFLPLTAQVAREQLKLLE